MGNIGIKNLPKAIQSPVYDINIIWPVQIDTGSAYFFLKSLINRKNNKARSKNDPEENDLIKLEIKALYSYSTKVPLGLA